MPYGDYFGNWFHPPCGVCGCFCQAQERRKFHEDNFRQTSCVFFAVWAWRWCKEFLHEVQWTGEKLLHEVQWTGEKLPHEVQWTGEKLPHEAQWTDEVEWRVQTSIHVECLADTQLV